MPVARRRQAAAAKEAIELAASHLSLAPATALTASEAEAEEATAVESVAAGKHAALPSPDT